VLSFVSVRLLPHNVFKLTMPSTSVAAPVTTGNWLAATSLLQADRRGDWIRADSCSL